MTTTVSAATTRMQLAERLVGQYPGSVITFGVGQNGEPIVSKLDTKGANAVIYPSLTSAEIAAIKEIGGASSSTSLPTNNFTFALPTPSVDLSTPLTPPPTRTAPLLLEEQDPSANSWGWLGVAGQYAFKALQHPVVRNTLLCAGAIRSISNLPLINSTLLTVARHIPGLAAQYHTLAFSLGISLLWHNRGLIGNLIPSNELLQTIGQHSKALIGVGAMILGASSLLGLKYFGPKVASAVFGKWLLGGLTIASAWRARHKIKDGVVWTWNHSPTPMAVKNNVTHAAQAVKQKFQALPASVQTVGLSAVGFKALKSTYNWLFTLPGAVTPTVQKSAVVQTPFKQVINFAFSRKFETLKLGAALYATWAYREQLRAGYVNLRNWLQQKAQAANNENGDAHAQSRPATIALRPLPDVPPEGAAVVPIAPVLDRSADAPLAVARGAQEVNQAQAAEVPPPPNAAVAAPEPAPLPPKQSWLTSWWLAPEHDSSG